MSNAHPPPHPLDLPEIRSLIAQALDQPTLASCARVCRAWHASFVPHLWCRLDLHDKRFLSTPKLIDFDAALKKHGHLVRDIRLEWMQMDFPAVVSSCCNLQRLGIYQSQVIDNESNTDLTQSWEDLFSLLSRNPRIEELAVQLQSKVIFPTAFWRSVASSLPLIRTLRIHGAMIVIEDKSNNGADTSIDAFLDACLTVERLDLDFIAFQCPSQSPCSRWTDCRIFPALRHLSFFGRTHLDLEFLSKCLASHALQSLRWSTHHQDHYTPAMLAPQVTRLIVEARLAALKSLELWDGMPFSDQEIASILDSLVMPLKELSVAESGFGELALTSLLRQPSQDHLLDLGHATDESAQATKLRRIPHTATLEDLDLSDCPDVTETMILRIGALSPNLKTFFYSLEPQQRTVV